MLPKVFVGFAVPYSCLEQVVAGFCFRTLKVKRDQFLIGKPRDAPGGKQCRVKLVIDPAIARLKAPRQVKETYVGNRWIT